jgi:hypothetical protein
MFSSMTLKFLFYSIYNLNVISWLKSLIDFYIKAYCKQQEEKFFDIRVHTK